MASPSTIAAAAAVTGSARRVDDRRQPGERGVRDAVELTYATSLDAAFTKPVAAEHLAGLLGQKDIRLESEFATGSVDGAGGRLVSWDEREIGFDLLVTVPLHGGAEFVERLPGLGVPVKELYQLLPKGPAKLAAKIAGIPKPRGCI